MEWPCLWGNYSTSNSPVKHLEVWEHKQYAGTTLQEVLNRCSSQKPRTRQFQEKQQKWETQELTFCPPPPFFIPFSQLPPPRLYFPWPCFPVRKVSEAAQFHLRCRHSNKLKSFTEREPVDPGRQIYPVDKHLVLLLKTKTSSYQYTPGHMHKISQKIYFQTTCWEPHKENTLFMLIMMVHGYRLIRKSVSRSSQNLNLIPFRKLLNITTPTTFELQKSLTVSNSSHFKTLERDFFSLTDTSTKHNCLLRNKL